MRTYGRTFYAPLGWFRRFVLSYIRTNARASIHQLSHLSIYCDLLLHLARRFWCVTELRQRVHMVWILILLLVDWWITIGSTLPRSVSCLGLLRAVKLSICATNLSRTNSVCQSFSVSVSSAVTRSADTWIGAWAAANTLFVRSSSMTCFSYKISLQSPVLHSALSIVS